MLDISHISHKEIINFIKDRIIDSYNTSFEFSFLAECPVGQNIRTVIRYILAQHDISPLWQHRLALVCDEMINNSVEHGSKKGDLNTFHIELNATKDYLDMIIEVTDGGHGKKTLAELRKILQQEHKQEMNPRKKRGRGLQIISEIADNVYFKDIKGKTLIGIEKRIEK